MAVARIFTSSPETADAIAGQLRAHGYTVEVVTSRDPEAQPADLEIVLESQRLESACTRAAELAGAGPALLDVYIAAGSFRQKRSAKETSAVDPQEQSSGHHSDTARLSPADTLNGVAAGLQHKRDLLAKALRKQRETRRIASRAAREQLAPERPEFDRTQGRVPQEEQPQRQAAVSLDQQIDQQSVSDFIHREQRAGNEGSGNPQQAEAAPYAAEPNQFSGGVAGERSHASIGTPPEVASEVCDNGIPPVAADATPAGAAAPRQSAALRKDNVASVDSPRGPAAIDDHRWRRIGMKPSFRRQGGTASRRAREWQLAVIISSVFAALLIFGWSVATRARVDPLPASITSSPAIEQELPFGAVTLKPTAAEPTHVPDLTRTPADRAAKPKSSPEAVRRESGASVVRKSNKSNKGVSYKTPENEIADDVVVRHFGSRRGQTNAADSNQPKTEKASLKRFSDLE